MNSHWNGSASNGLSRRDLLRRASAGFGSLALAGLLGQEALAEGPDPKNPLAPRTPHFAPRAKRVIFLFMHGGPSQVDTFDYKPILQRDHGKPLPFAKPRVVSGQTGNLLGSPWKFAQHGQSGLWMSELFPKLAERVDDLCVINGMHGSNSRHGGALLELHTGSDTFVRPSMGSWIAYGLGTENQDLPGYITVCPNPSHGGVNNYASAFLPAVYHGTPIGSTGVSVEQARIPFIENQTTPRDLQRLQLDLVQEMNRDHLDRAVADQALEGRIAAFELAFRMQTEAPDIQEITGESEATKRLYGLDDPVTKPFGLQCLYARRFAERGVRFVQVSHSYKWDQHGGLRKDSRGTAGKSTSRSPGSWPTSRPVGCLRTPWSSGAVSSAGPRPLRGTTAGTTTRKATPCGWPAAV